MLARVSRVGDAIAEVEVERFQEFLFKEVPFDHPKVFHVLITDLKFHAGSKEMKRNVL